MSDDHGNDEEPISMERFQAAARRRRKFQGNFFLRALTLAAMTAALALILVNRDSCQGKAQRVIEKFETQLVTPAQEPTPQDAKGVDGTSK